MNIGEVFIALGFDVDAPKLKGFVDEIGALGGEMTALAGVAAGAVYGIDKFIAGNVDHATSLNNIKLKYDENREALQKWSLAANAFNPLFSVAQGEDAIVGINKALADAFLGNKGGIPVKLRAQYIKDGAPVKATDYLQELHDQLPQLIEFYKAFGDTDTKHAALLRDLGAMGVDENMFNVLKESNSSIDEKTKGKIISDEDINRLADTNKQMTELDQGFSKLKNNMATAIEPFVDAFVKEAIPAVKELTDDFAEFAKYTKSIAPEIEADMHAIFHPIEAADEILKNIKISLDSIAKMKKPDILNFVDEFKQDSRAAIRHLWEQPDDPNSEVYTEPKEGDKTINNSMTQNNTIQVHGAQDPHATAAATEGIIVQMMKRADSQMNSGAVR